MRNSNRLSELTIKWNEYVEGLSNEVESYFVKQLKAGASRDSISNGIYDILTKRQFDGEAFDYIYASVKLENPNLSRDQFLKQFTKTKIDGKKINLFDNIDNQKMTERFMTRFDDKVQTVIDRADRLKKMRMNITRFGDNQSTYELSRTIETIGTRYKNLESQLLDTKRGLRNTRFLSSNRKLLKQKAERLTEQFKEEKAIYKVFKKDYDSLMKSRTDLSPTVFNKRYADLMEKVELDLRERQVPYEAKQTVVSSGGEPVKTTAKTELARAEAQTEIQKYNELKNSVKADEVLVAKWELNPNRTWLGHDICDENAAHNEGYGKGVWMADEVPRVPAHVSCGCTVTYYKTKRKK